MPGFSGVAIPIGPVRRITGTVGFLENSLFNQLFFFFGFGDLDIRTSRN
jgi:hypothetical protein